MHASAPLRPRLRRLRRALVLVASVLLAAEAGLRIAGATDFPVYRLDPAIGYLYAPRQSGSFLNRNRWAVNDLSMPTPRTWAPEPKPNLLLVGNSIVAGGNPYDQSERLASFVERRVGARWNVWPVATGGWSTVNQLSYLERHREVVGATDFIVWIYTSGGLQAASPWLGDDVFPLERPASALGYVLRREVLRRLGLVAAQGEGAKPGTLPTRSDDTYASHLASFATALGAVGAATGRRSPGVLLLYPTAAQLATARSGSRWLAEREDLARVAGAHGLPVIDLSAYPEWTAALYRDGVHPTVTGNELIARIVVDALTLALEE